jgi:VanZ family protein
MLKLIKKWSGRNAYSLALGTTIFVIFLSLGSFSSVGVQIFKVKNSDKLAHIAAYLFLSFSWLFATRKRFTSINQRVLLVVSIIAFGIILEVLQEVLTTHRKADLNDVVANAVGIILAAVTFNQLRTWLNSMLK